MKPTKVLTKHHLYVGCRITDFSSFSRKILPLTPYVDGHKYAYKNSFFQLCCRYKTWFLALIQLVRKFEGKGRERLFGKESGKNTN